MNNIADDLHKAYDDGYADGQRDRWISVDDALPPDGQLVIGAVYTTDIICMEDGETLEDALKRTNREAAKHPRVEPCWYGEDGSGDPESVGWYGYDGFPMIWKPRYWMAIPKPPVVEVDDEVSI